MYVCLQNNKWNDSVLQLNKLGIRLQVLAILLKEISMYMYIHVTCFIIVYCMHALGLGYTFLMVLRETK